MPVASVDRPAGQLSRLPFADLCYWLAAALFLGLCAWRAAGGHWLSQPNRDIFQHLAALQVLIDDIGNPANPFMVTADGSRHFHPYWVMMAGLARWLGWDAWQALAAASYLSMAVVATGIYMFARAYFRTAWAPLVLLGTMMLGWWFPISHTGYHSIATLAEGAGYPAAMMIGASLALWALVIRALDRTLAPWPILPLTALMFATHQLGAVMALIVVGCLLLFWPEGDRRRRMTASAMIVAGVALSMLWPYHNPVTTLFAAGSPGWRGGPNFYGPRFMIGIFLPAIIGVLGLVKPPRQGIGWPILAALLLLLAAFFTGLAGVQLGQRFGAPAALLLHIGMAGWLIRLWQPGAARDRTKLTVFTAAILTAMLQYAFMSQLYYPREKRIEDRYGSLLVQARELTADIPDDRPVAAFDITAWPLVGVGQKVHSIPWPEPLIHDLAKRQDETEWLFADGISPAERRARAKKLGVTTLVVHFDTDGRGPWQTEPFGRLLEGARSVRRSGPMVRIDL